MVSQPALRAARGGRRMMQDWRDDLKIRLLAVGLAVGLLGARAAQARVDPTPPPSGIVIHLFGQDSVMSHVLPVAPASGAPAPVAGAKPAQGGGYVEPSMHDILHQMFVTGDPNAPPGFSTGKRRLQN